MATGKNINDSALQKVTDFTNALNRWYASATSSTKDGYIIIIEFIQYLQTILEQKIHIPSTQPALSGSDLTLNMASNRQAIFEPRKSVADLTIDSDFNFIIDNDTNAIILVCTLSLTDTRIITFESDVFVSNASSIGAWDDGTKKLTLAAGTDDLIEFNLLRYNTSSKWRLVVGEVDL